MVLEHADVELQYISLMSGLPEIQSGFRIAKSRCFSQQHPRTLTHTRACTHTHCSRLPSDRWTRWKRSHPVSNRDISNTVSHHHMQTLHWRLRRQTVATTRPTPALYLESAALMNSTGNRGRVAAGMNSILSKVCGVLYSCTQLQRFDSV